MKQFQLIWFENKKTNKPDFKMGKISGTAKLDGVRDHYAFKILFYYFHLLLFYDAFRQAWEFPFLPP